MSRIPLTSDWTLSLNFSHLAMCRNTFFLGNWLMIQKVKPGRPTFLLFSKINRFGFRLLYIFLNWNRVGHRHDRVSLFVSDLDEQPWRVTDSFSLPQCLFSIIQLSASVMIPSSYFLRLIMTSQLIIFAHPPTPHSLSCTLINRNWGGPGG